jgi:hypothetical protein
MHMVVEHDRRVAALERATPPANERYARQALGRYLLERRATPCWFHDTLRGSRDMIGGGDGLLYSSLR